jgi:ribosomal protein L28
MAQIESKGHTSKPKTKRQFLPPLQKRIFIYLAKTRPQTINETRKGVRSQYKSSWMALNYLEEKGLVTKIGVKPYRGNEYPCYWLTPAGVFLALVEGINPSSLLTKTIELHPENKTLQCIVEISTVLGTDMYRIAYPAILDKGKLEKDDVALMLAAQLQKNLSFDQISDLIAIMRKYPEQFGDFKEQRSQMLENLKRVESILKSTSE